MSAYDLSAYNPVEFGEVRARVAALIEEIAAMKEAIREQNALIGALLQKVTAAEGGLRTLLAIGGAGATLGAGLAWLAAHLRLD